MRRSTSSGSSAIQLSLRMFGWDATKIAVLSHSTLPWTDAFNPELTIEGVALDARKWAARDALSLLAQYAGHLAFLRFAGVGDVLFKASEWRVISRRASDVRLVRIAGARPGESENVVPLDLMEQFSEVVSAPPLETLAMGWASPEQVYLEIHRLLQAERADLQWFRLAAGGLVLAPGAEALGDLASRERQVLEYADELVLHGVRNFATFFGEDEVLLLGGPSASPLSPGSAFPQKYRTVEAVEGVLETSKPLLIVVSQLERWDELSRHLLDLLGGVDASWVVPLGMRSGAQLAMDSRLFVISRTMSDLRSLQKSRPAKLSGSGSWMDAFPVEGDLDRFLMQGILPPAAADTAMQEPLRSYLAALAVLGHSTSASVADRYLESIGCRLPLNALPESVLELSPERVSFRSLDVQRQLARSVPASSARALAGIAAPLFEEAGDLVSAAGLMLTQGQGESAQRLLEKIDWEGLDDPPLIALLERASLAQVAALPKAGPRFARHLLSRGRYREGRAVAAALRSPAGEIVLAQLLRRTGDYEDALSRLAALDVLARSPESTLLEAELRRLQGDCDASRRALDGVETTEETDRPLLAYHRCLLAFDSGLLPASEELATLPVGSYLASRVETYRRLADGEPSKAILSARAAVAVALCIPDEIDASLDLVYALFTAGQWDAARLAARSSLSTIEEAEGDRAAAGILFTLAYLCADSAQFAQAEQMLARLRRFYKDRKDSRRARELDVLAAQIELGRGQFERVLRIVQSTASVPMADDLREAVSLAHDEASWVMGNGEPAMSRGLTANLELQDRHLLQIARRDPAREPRFNRPFHEVLNQFERAWMSGSATPPPAPKPETMSEALQLHRSLMALSRRRPHEIIDAHLLSLAREHGLASSHSGPTAGQAVQILSTAVTAAYPFAADSFAVEWEYASRNRLGRWSRIGSRLSPEEDLDNLAESVAIDWTRGSDRSFLYMAGSGQWAPAVREAVAETFVMRVANDRLKRLVEEPEPLQTAQTVEGVVGESALMRELTARIRQVARSEAAVCIEGESGTGKELLARAVHHHSARKSKRFTAINCAAIPENLLESELFGAAKGAFTGADRDRAGLIEVTDGGTLFLDEIGELPLPAQAKLLRFLQEGEFRRVGDPVVRHSDVRIVSATNRLLEQAVEAGTFRQDLYYRVHVVEVTVPPLRDRGGDVLLLARAFLDKERETSRGGPSRFSDEAESLLLSYRWPGNVRELQNTVKAAVALAGTEARQIDVPHLPGRLHGSPRLKIRSGSYNEEIVRFRRDLIERSLLESAGNQNQAAKKLGMSRQALAYQIRELGILVRQR